MRFSASVWYNERDEFDNGVLRMMDNICDFIVTKKKTAANVWGRIATIFGAAVLCLVLLSIRVLIYAAPLILVCVGIGVWYVWRFFHVEYEYAMVGGELKVDVIYGQRQRKNLLKTSANRFESFGPCNEAALARLQSPDITVRVNAVSSPDDEGIYYAVFPGEKGRTALLFQPSDKILRLIRMHAQRSIFRDMPV